MAREETRLAPGNLPVELNSFVGRGRELSEVRRLLGVAHAITLIGPGGIGKSRLALSAARKLRRQFPDGVWIVELAELDGPDRLAYAVARSLGVQERRNDAIDEALLERLRERRLLLVLDNCEHLLDSCRELVASVVSRCERVRILCTSRERLDVAGEAVVVLSGLDVPEDGQQLSAAGLGEVEALRLLVDRAVTVAPDFALTEENWLASAEICRRLDGVPLAIELAAVRLASMTAGDLRERLDDRLRLLAAGNRAGPGRSQTLRATVDWSYELLTEGERILWRRLSVFAGSFGLGAAEDVCSGEGLERERIVDLVGSLVAKSILTMGHGSRRGRYRLLETLRLYGAERLAEVGEDVELARRHAAWYARLVSGGNRPWWGTRDQGQGFETLDVEWANVEAALDFLTESRPDAEMGLCMAADLWLYWLVRGRYRAGSRRVAAFLEMAPAPTATRAMALWAFAFLSEATGEYGAALSAVEEARWVCDRTGGDRELAYALHGLALVHLRLGHTGLAGDFAGQSRDRMLRVDDPTGRALTAYLLATVIASTGRSEEARRVAGEALEASELAGDEMIRGLSNGLLGTFEWVLGDFQAAEASHKEATRIHDVIGHRWGMLTSLEGLAWVAESTGRLERAALLLGAGAALSQEHGIVLFPYAQVHHDACEAAVRAGLDDSCYRNCWEEGYMLGREQVVAAAVEDALAPDRPAPRTAAAANPDDLSPRELEVARLAANGLSNPAIAADLFVSVATVKTHVSHILAKLGLQSRVQLASWVAANDVGPSITPDR